MRRIAWSKDALAELLDAIGYIAERNPIAAADQLDRIDETIQLLADIPVGRPGRVHGTYEKPVLSSPYIVAYHVDDTTLTVLRVIHGRRHWPADEWPKND